MVMLKRIELSGYKSIKRMSLELGPLNVLIGANGSGKSNLLSFFLMLKAAAHGNLRSFVAKAGGAHTLLHYGAKTTREILGTLRFAVEKGGVTYQLSLTQEDTLDVAVSSADGDSLVVEYDAIVRGGAPARERTDVARPLVQSLLSQVHLYQFDDTSATAAARLTGYIDDHRSLNGDAGNLAAVLYKFQRTQPNCYRRIVGTIRQIVPCFGDFALQPLPENPNSIKLHWRERDSEHPFGPHQLSDGSLRAMALVTLLLQPENELPPVIILDEPELGLHPAGISVVSALIKKAAFHCQLIVATQSAALVDRFDPDEIVVVDRLHRESEFKRYTEEELAEWLSDYTLSELWEKNVLGGSAAPWYD